jgi:hypothetical protein
MAFLLHLNFLRKFLAHKIVICKVNQGAKILG